MITPGDSEAIPLWVEAICTVVFSLGSSVVAWLLADSKSKSRLGFMEERVVEIKAQQENDHKSCQEKLSSLQIQEAKSQQENEEMHRSIDRLDNAKASKDVVQGLSNQISTLQDEIDRRFDRLEKLVLDTKTK